MGDRSQIHNWLKNLHFLILFLFPSLSQASLANSAIMNTMNANRIPVWMAANALTILEDFHANAHVATRENGVTLKWVCLLPLSRMNNSSCLLVPLFGNKHRVLSSLLPNWAFENWNYLKWYRNSVETSHTIIVSIVHHQRAPCMFRFIHQTTAQPINQPTDARHFEFQFVSMKCHSTLSLNDCHCWMALDAGSHLIHRPSVSPTISAAAMRSYVRSMQLRLKFRENKNFFPFAHIHIHPCRFGGIAIRIAIIY